MVKSHYPALMKKLQWQIQQQQLLLTECQQKLGDLIHELDDLSNQIQKSAQVNDLIIPEIESMRHQYLNQLLNQQRLVQYNKNQVEDEISEHNSQLIEFKTDIKLLEKLFAKQQDDELKQQTLLQEKTVEDLVLARTRSQR